MCALPDYYDYGVLEAQGEHRAASKRDGEQGGSKEKRIGVMSALRESEEDSIWRQLE